MSLIIVLIYLLYFFITGLKISNDEGNWISFVTMMLYVIILNASKWQDTVGKKLLNIQVIGKDGGRISIGRSACRFLFSFFSASILFVGYLMAVWTKKKQTLHDMICSTFVIRN